MIVVASLAGLCLLVLALLSYILIVKRTINKTSRQIINPLAFGQRYRDGAITYGRYEGRCYNIEIANPNESHNARYQRRHSARQHKNTKPWEK